MRLTLFAITVLCALLLGAECAAASGTLSGAGEWRYARYERDGGNEQSFDGTTLFQQYSLLWEKSGLIRNGTGGKYDLSLGAEWTSVDTDVSGASGSERDLQVTTSKILYRGDVLVAPGGLPFRLHLYSRDMQRTQVSRGTSATGLEAFEPKLMGKVMRSPLVGDIFNGINVTTGGTLLVGIRNGSYLGRYRDVLSTLPRLLVDYRENYVRDLKAGRPSHYRERDLAFVSLNKKDNWFHYRTREFRDFLDPVNDESVTSYLLGTIDHSLKRQWINLTNWIRVSADISYVATEKTARDIDDKTVGDAVKEYHVNLFSDARRSNWRGSNWTSFTRVVNPRSLEKNLEVPFYFSGEIDRNTSWRLNLIGSRNQLYVPFALETEKDSEDVLYVTSKVETFRQKRFVLVPSVEAEVKGGTRGEGGGVRVGAELFSNRSYRPTVDLFGEYSLAYFQGTPIDGEPDVAFWEQKLVGRLERDIGRRLRVGGEQRVVFGSGTLDHSVTEYISAESDLSLLGAPGEASNREGDVLKTVTRLFAEHTFSRNLSNRVDAVFDYLSTEGDAQDALDLTHVMRYDRPTWQFIMTNELVRMNNAQNAVVNSAPDTFGGNWDTLFSHKSELQYAPSRALEGGLAVDFAKTSGAGGGSTQWKVDQALEYSLFTVNGIIRKLAQISEEIAYERFVDITGRLEVNTTFTLSGIYAPTKWSELQARLRYRTEEAERDRSGYLIGFTGSLNFEKLQVVLDYAYGAIDNDNSLQEQKEQRWEVAVKKTF